MSDMPPDAYLISGLMVYGDLARGASIARAFRVMPPDLLGATETYKEEVHERLARLCGSLAGNERMQWQWRCTADFTSDLDAYDAATANADPSTPAPALLRRQERSRTYRTALAERRLRRQQLTLFVSIRVEKSAPLAAGRGALRSHYQTLIAQYAAQFTQIEERLRTILGTDIAVSALTDLATFECCYRFFNPTADANAATDYAALFDPELSLQDLVCNSDVIASSNSGVYFDGHYHGLLTLKRLGKFTHMGMINALTNLPFLDYQLTLNVSPRDTDRETLIEEAAAEVLENEQTERFKRTRQVAIDKKDAKIKRLSTGHVRPYDLVFVIRAWAKTESALSTLLAALRNAVQSMRGAETYQIALPASTRKIFCSTWPGYVFSPYSARTLYIEDSNLCDLIPFSSSFTGLLRGADALFEGPQHQLIGIQTVVSDTPQQTVVFGASRSGKSVTLQDVLLQTAPLVAYTVIIEEGASHTHFTKQLGGRTLIIHPESNYCINYLDTGGLPLSRTHKAFAVALTAHMAGRVADDQKQTTRASQLTHYIDRLYEGQFEDWSRRHRDLLPTIARQALAIHRWRERMPEDTDPTTLDAWVAIRDGLAAKDPIINAFVDNLSEDEILRFTKDPLTERAYINHAYAFFTPEEYPQHSQLAEHMLLHPSPDHPADEIRQIATNLQSWSRDSGTYGPLFDGVTNVPLGHRVDHFELARIPNHQHELKSAVALLITGVVRQHIYKLPRTARKQILFEELARYVDVPDAAKLVDETFAQLAKTGTWVCAVVQQYAQFKRSPVRPIIMGNAKQFWIFRQMDTADLDDIAEAVALPAAMKMAVRQYPIPADLPENERYSAFCYHIASRTPSITGTVYNRSPRS
jgi:hypothetical protein